MKLKPTEGLFKFDFNDSHAYLGVPIDADATGIRDRYKEVARLMHPDSACWKTTEEKMLATKLFSSLITHSYGQLSRSTQLQEQLVMLELLGKRILVESNKMDLVSSAAQTLYKESSAAMQSTYQRLVRELADRQYQKLQESIEITGQISELNFVYLLRRQNQAIGAQPSGGRVISGTETYPGSEPAKTVEVAKAAETIKSPLVDNALRRADEYINMRNWAKASLELREVVKEEPHNAIAHAQLAIVYYRQNQATMAKVHINKAIQLAPNEKIVKDAKQELKKLMSDGAAKVAAETKGSMFGGMFGGKK
jgi:tetratricopeptide (TPR) repeat protein